jgi:hypothetical protein
LTSCPFADLMRMEKERPTGSHIRKLDPTSGSCVRKRIRDAVVRRVTHSDNAVEKSMLRNQIDLRQL